MEKSSKDFIERAAGVTLGAIPEELSDKIPGKRKQHYREYP